ncbi:MAG TPA: hypothetical protein VLZ74_11155 [Methylocella sp.]|nr:hypothetical protein [Methylocella sp.]
MSDEKPVSSEYHPKLLDVLKGWLPVLTVCGTALWGLYTYQQNQAEAEKSRIASARQAEEQRRFEAEKALDVRRIELQKPFIDQQFAVYTAFNRIVGEILHAEAGSPELDTATNKFKQYSLGEVSLVEDEDVHKSKEQFANTLRTYTETTRTAKNLSCHEGATAGPCVHLNEQMKVAYERLTADATALASALRKSIQQSWSGNLGKH